MQEFDDTFQESFKLYCKYIQTVHNGPEPAEEDFKNNYVNQPLTPIQQCISISDLPFYGPYHQQYFLDGRMIAVFIFDILPRGILNRYLFYDPDYFTFSMGTYLILQ